MSIHMSKHLMCIDIFIHRSYSWVSMIFERAHRIPIRMSSRISIRMSVRISIRIPIRMSVRMSIRMAMRMSVRMSIRMQLYTGQSTGGAGAQYQNTTLAECFLSFHLIDGCCAELARSALRLRLTFGAMCRFARVRRQRAAAVGLRSAWARVSPISFYFKKNSAQASEGMMGSKLPPMASQASWKAGTSYEVPDARYWRNKSRHGVLFSTKLVLASKLSYRIECSVACSIRLFPGGLDCRGQPRRRLCLPAGARRCSADRRDFPQDAA